MKKAILTIALAIIIAAVNSSAQSSTPVTPSSTGSTLQDEIRSVSGDLKEAYAAVFQQLNLLNKEIASMSDGPTAIQASRQGDLKTSLLQIEGLLSTVNTSSEESWPEVKAKAQKVRTAALGLVPAKP